MGEEEGGTREERRETVDKEEMKEGKKWLEFN